MFDLSQNPKIVEQNYEGDRTLLFIPGISFSDFALKQYQGCNFFEERYLYFLCFLKQPKTKLILVLSEGMESAVYDYFMEHCAQALGIKNEELSARIIRVNVPSIPRKSLTYSILQSPEYVEKIKNLISDPDNTFIECFKMSELELELSRSLDVPVYGLSKSAFELNTKSGARKLFKEVGANVPEGFEDLFSLKDIFEKQTLFFSNREVKKVVAKVNDGGSGMGFIFTSREQKPADYPAFEAFVQAQLVHKSVDVLQAIQTDGAIAEVFISAEQVFSPSAQFEIKPDGSVINLATHDQILNGVEYIGVNFPAHESYRKQIIEIGYTIAKAAAQKGAMGIFAIDFLVTRDRDDDPWKVWTIEINARKGGTNHTYMWAKYLTDAIYDEARGILECSKGDVYYRGSEVFMKYDWLKQIEPAVFLSYIKKSGLDFNHETKSGVIIHLLSPLPYFGKFGCTVVGHNREEVEKFCKQLEKIIFSLEPKYEIHKTI